jgi:hypothetical protein
MEILFGLIIAVIVVSLIYFNRDNKGLDVNNDGKVDAEDAKAAVENTVQGVKKQVRRAAKPKSPATVKTSKTRGRKPKKAE